MSDFSKVSEETITRAMQGDEEAFTQIYKTYYKRVYFMGLQFFKNEDMAKDVVQEVFIKVYKQLHTLQAPKAFGTWLHVVTYRMCQDLNRKKTKTIELGEDEKIEDFADVESAEVSNIVANTRMKETIIESLNTMNESLRIVGVMRYLEDMKVQEIADVLNISKNTVGTRLMKIRKVLQKDLINEGYSIDKEYANVILTPIILHQIYMSMFNTTMLPETVGLSLLDNVLKMKAGTNITKTNVNKGLVSLGVGVTVVMAYSGYKLLEDTKPIEIQDIQYSTELTNVDVPVEIVLNTTLEDQLLHIYYQEQIVPYTMKNNHIYFNATENGNYTIETKDITKTITISSIDREVPEITDVQYDGTLLTFQITSEEDMDYEQSYVEYQNQRIKIDESHQLTGEFRGDISFNIYDITGNHSTYTITINDISQEVVS